MYFLKTIGFVFIGLIGLGIAGMAGYIFYINAALYSQPEYIPSQYVLNNPLKSVSPGDLSPFKGKESLYYRCQASSTDFGFDIAQNNKRYEYERFKVLWDELLNKDRVSPSLPYSRSDRSSLISQEAIEMGNNSGIMRVFNYASEKENADGSIRYFLLYELVMNTDTVIVVAGTDEVCIPKDIAKNELLKTVASLIHYSGDIIRRPMAYKIQPVLLMSKKYNRNSSNKIIIELSRKLQDIINRSYEEIKFGGGACDPKTLGRCNDLQKCYPANLLFKDPDSNGAERDIRGICMSEQGIQEWEILKKEYLNLVDNR